MTGPTCFDASQIARAATLDLDHPHFGECLDCRRRLDADRKTREMFRALPMPQLANARRTALAAEIIAVAAARRARGPQIWRRATIASCASALAAALALWLARPAPVEPMSLSVPTFGSSETVATSSSSVGFLEAPPEPQPPRLEASGATFRHLTGGDRDVITLSDGVLEVDTRNARDVDVRIGDATVRVDEATVKIRAVHRRIVSVQVVVGSAQVTAAGRRVTLQRDAMWLAGPSATQVSLTAFRHAWVALRAGRHREAMELFDRVSDPVVIEEATYWAAIAAQRSGDAALAKERLDAFLRRFPDSPYAADLRP